MAESADILTADEQVVMLPNLRAGCSMADMATLVDVEEAWSEMVSSTNLSTRLTKRTLHRLQVKMMVTLFL